MHCIQISCVQGSVGTLHTSRCAFLRNATSTRSLTYLLLLQSLRNRHGWDYQMMHALNMTVALHMDGRPTKRQAEVSYPAHSLGHPCVGL